jgi:hypothetical protein
MITTMSNPKTIYMLMQGGNHVCNERQLESDKRLLSAEVSRLYQLLDTLAEHFEKSYGVSSDWNKYTGRLKVITDKDPWVRLGDEMRSTPEGTKILEDSFFKAFGNKIVEENGKERKEK